MRLGRNDVTYNFEKKSKSGIELRDESAEFLQQ